MNAIFKKLNLKNQKEIIVLNSPNSFKNELLSVNKTVKVREELKGVKEINFALVFVTRKNEIDKAIN